MGWLRAPDSDLTRSSPLLAPAGWAKFIAPATPGWSAVLRSRSCPPRSPRTVSGCSRFEREARLASALNHPNIVTIHELGQDGSTHYIAMELIEGRRWASCSPPARCPYEVPLKSRRRVAEGLAKAHEAGIAHRDLKPGNVMVSHDGFVKILDFGLAKLAPPSSELSETRNISGVAHSTGSDAGNAAIHVARAGQQRPGGFPVRPILVRLGAVRNGGWEAPF